MSPRGRRLGILGANGWLGRALAEAVVASGFVEPENLTLSYRSVPPAVGQLPGATWTRDCQAVVDCSDLVVVSVRPEQFGGLAVDARGRTVVSFMAGVSFERLTRSLGTDAVVRAMPNAALEIRRSYTPWCATAAVTAEDRLLVDELLRSGGTTDEVGSEGEIDYLTGLSGSGPAFPALLADAMVRDAVARGLEPEVARRAAVAVVSGAGRLLGDATVPGDVVDVFLTYRGTTAAAIEAMVAAGFRGAVGRGLAAAEARASLIGGAR